MKKRREPYKNQIEAINFVSSRNRGGLFMDPGLGKTLSVIRGLKLDKISRSEKCIIVCPASIRTNWENELKLEAVNLNHVEIYSYEGITIEVRDELLGVRSKDDRSKKIKRLMNNFNYLVVDESHYIKNWDSQRTTAVVSISMYLKYAWYLTGSPALVKSSDLHPTLSSIEPGKWGNIKDFEEKYCEKVKDRWSGSGYKYTGFRNHAELNKRMENLVLVQKKDEILDQLSEKREGVFYIQADEEMYMQMINDSDIEVFFKQRNSDHISEVRREVCFYKMNKYVMSLKDREIQRGIIFCWHRDVAELLSKKMNGKLIYGGMSFESRDQIIASWKNGDVDWLVLTIGSSGVGLNLQETNYVGMFELPWTYGELEQAFSRVWRIGNKGVYIEYVIVKDSIDEIIYKVCMSRGREVDKLLGSK